MSFTIDKLPKGYAFTCTDYIREAKPQLLIPTFSIKSCLLSFV